MQADVFRAWITAAAAVIEEQRDHLTQLDAAIGDADHGINLSRGFTAVLSALESAAPATPACRIAARAMFAIRRRSMAVTPPGRR